MTLEKFQERAKKTIEIKRGQLVGLNEAEELADSLAQIAQLKEALEWMPLPETSGKGSVGEWSLRKAREPRR